MKPYPVLWEIKSNNLVRYNRQTLHNKVYILNILWIMFPNLHVVMIISSCFECLCLCQLFCMLRHSARERMGGGVCDEKDAGTSRRTLDLLYSGNSVLPCGSACELTLDCVFYVSCELNMLHTSPCELWSVCELWYLCAYRPVELSCHLRRNSISWVYVKLC